MSTWSSRQSRWQSFPRPCPDGFWPSKEVPVNKCPWNGRFSQRMIEALCHLCSISIENNRIEISAPIVPAKLTSWGHSNLPSINLNSYQPSFLLDKILSSELWGCLALSHVPLQLKCLVQGKDYLQQIISAVANTSQRTSREDMVISVIMKAESQQKMKEPGHRWVRWEAGIAPPLSLQRQPLSKLEIAEKLQGRDYQKPSSLALLPSVPGRGQGQGSPC